MSGTGIDFLLRFSEVAQEFTGASESKIRRLLNEPALHSVEDLIREKAKTQGLDFDSLHMYAPYRWFYYVLSRITRPTLVVETGVWYGMSSAFILQGLENNGRGDLYSIDLPNLEYENDSGDPICDGVGEPENTGLLIPTNLHHRWHLISGKVQERLEPLLTELGEIDVFIHDSEHTYEGMMFEFKTAFEAVKHGGLLISDDVGSSAAFIEFVKQVDCKSTMFYMDYNKWIGVLVKS